MTYGYAAPVKRTDRQVRPFAGSGRHVLDRIQISKMGDAVERERNT